MQHGPLASLGHAVLRTWDISVFSLKMLGRMLLGQISWKHLSGPVTIADFAADRRAATPTAAAELASPAREELFKKISECLHRLGREMLRKLQYAAQALDACARRLVHPAERLRSYQQLVTQLKARLAFALSHKVHRCSTRVERLQASLAGLDPAAVLARGYSITYSASGEVLRSAAGVRTGERISTTLAQGRIESEVKKT